MTRRHLAPLIGLVALVAGAARGGAPGKAQLPNLRLDLKTKTIELDGVLCIGEYPLELLVCQNTLRDYESMVSSPCEPSVLHAALLALGLKPRVRDKKDPARIVREGDRLDVLIRFRRDGKLVTLEPRQMILNVETKKHIEATPFVFYGSFFFPVEEDGKKKMVYLADAEDWLIGLLGDTASVIDLAPSAVAEYGMLAIDPEVVPPKGTKATVIIRPARNPDRRGD